MSSPQDPVEGRMHPWDLTISAAARAGADSVDLTPLSEIPRRKKLMGWNAAAGGKDGCTRARRTFEKCRVMKQRYNSEISPSNLGRVSLAL